MAYQQHNENFRNGNIACEHPAIQKQQDIPQIVNPYSTIAFKSRTLFLKHDTQFFDNGKQIIKAHCAPSLTGFYGIMYDLLFSNLWHPHN